MVVQEVIFVFDHSPYFSEYEKVQLGLSSIHSASKWRSFSLLTTFLISLNTEYTKGQLGLVSTSLGVGGGGGGGEVCLVKYHTFPPFCATYPYK